MLTLMLSSKSVPFLKDNVCDPEIMEATPTLSLLTRIPVFKSPERDPEYKAVLALLDAIQNRTDHSIYSKENPEDRYSDSNQRISEGDHLALLLHPLPVTNKTIQGTLEEMHDYYVDLSKSLLLVEE